MAASEVKLIGTWPSPYMNRVQLALKLKSVEYKLIEVNPYEKGEVLVKANPVYKKIPVLIHAGNTICESLVIVQYIDDIWTNGPSILPSDPYDRAMARFWATYIDDKVTPLFKQLREVQGDDAKREIMTKIFEGLALLEDAFNKCSKGGTFFGGESIGFIDITLGSFLGWIRVIEIMSNIKVLDESKTPGLAGWAERFYSETSVKGVVPEPQKLLELVKMLQAKEKAASSQ